MFRNSLLSLSIILCFLNRGLCKLGGVKLWFYHNAAIGYCVLKKVKFNPTKVHFHGNNYLQFQNNYSVKIGDYFLLSSSGIDNSLQSKIIVHKGATLEIGEYSGMTNVCIHCYNRITIGHHVNIGAGSMIFDTDFHSTSWKDRLSRSTDVRNKKTAPVCIGDFVFIGTRCIIGKGVTIGEKSIIAAGSVVVKDIPDHCVAGGNPCRVIKYLED